MANTQGDKQKVRAILDAVKKEGRDSLTAPEGKLICDAYGINVPKEGVVSSAKEAGTLASSMGFPVVMKIVSPDILHKTEAGGVLVGVDSAEAAKKGFDTIMANAKKYDAKAKLAGVQVQQLLRAAGVAEARQDRRDHSPVRREPLQERRPARVPGAVQVEQRRAAAGLEQVEHEGALA